MGEPQVYALTRQHAEQFFASRRLFGAGGGGEYTPQSGFGWTNGVALDLLARFDFPHLEAVDAE
jgi:neutral trehalase